MTTKTTVVLEKKDIELIEGNKSAFIREAIAEKLGTIPKKLLKKQLKAERDMLEHQLKMVNDKIEKL